MNFMEKYVRKHKTKLLKVSNITLANTFFLDTGQMVLSCSDDFNRLECDDYTYGFLNMIRFLCHRQHVLVKNVRGSDNRSYIRDVISD